MKRIATMVVAMLVLGISLSRASEYPLPEKSYPSVANSSSVWMLEVIVVPGGCESPSKDCLSERTWYVDPGSKITFDMSWDDRFTFKLRGIKRVIVVEDKGGYTLNKEKFLVTLLVDRVVSFKDEKEKTIMLRDEDFSNPEEYTGADPGTLPALENKTERWLLGSELHISGSCGAFYSDSPCSRGRIIYLEPGNRVRYKASEGGCRLEITGIVSSFWGIQNRSVYVENFHNAAPNILVSGYYWLFPEKGSVSLDFKYARGPASFQFR